MKRINPFSTTNNPAPILQQRLLHMTDPVPQYQAIIHQWQEEMIVTEMTLDGLEGTSISHRQTLPLLLNFLLVYNVDVGLSSTNRLTCWSPQTRLWDSKVRRRGPTRSFPVIFRSLCDFFPLLLNFLLVNNCYGGTIVTWYNQVIYRGRNRKEKDFKRYFSFYSWRKDFLPLERGLGKD